MPDAFAIVLHSHLPYARGAGRWPHGEEWIHEAILGTYLPLLVALHDLRAQGVRFQVTLGITPILLEQLADHDIDARFVEYADDQVTRATRDAEQFAAAGASNRAGLASFYAHRYVALREAYLVRFGRDLVGAFSDLGRTGHVEILTSAATHGYLPLLDERSVQGQLAIGLASTERLTGLRPHGIWLPECAYRPGLEDALEAHGLDHFFTDSTLFSDTPTTAARRTLLSLRTWSAGAVAQLEPPPPASATADAFRPYLVGSSGVAAVARHSEVSGQVWSAATGYPGDEFYREFHRKDDQSGLRYWRVTDTATDLGRKADYDIERAAERARSHAAHFIRVVRDALADHRARTGRDGLLTTTFDSELFGHWWFEGVDWLSQVLRELGHTTTTVARYLADEPPRERIALREGSWGKNNDHSTWLNADTAWMWEELGRLADAFAAAGTALPNDALLTLPRVPPGESRVPPGESTGPLRARAARQAARELLLAQSSDWLFLRTTGQATDYGIERFKSHVMRFTRALELWRRGTAEDEAELRTLERADNPFPDADPASFAGVPPGESVA